LQQGSVGVFAKIRNRSLKGLEVSSGTLPRPTSRHRDW
jgi:hypothetical protein